MSVLKSNFGSEILPSSWVNEAAKLLAGIQTVDIAGTGTYTLSETEYLCRLLVLTGTLTGNRNVVVPTEGARVWIVYNNTAGAFSVTVKTAAGTGKIITQGRRALVYCDGANVDAAFLDGDITALLGLTGALQAPTQINDANGNEILKFASVASAVNEVSLTNAAATGGPFVEATGGDTNIDITIRGKGTGGAQVSRSGGKLGFFGAAVVARAAALTQTYATADRTLSAYTSDPESAAYTGAADGEAKLADLNALRVAYETLRVFTEDLAGFVNAMVDDMQAYGLEQ